MEMRSDLAKCTLAHAAKEDEVEEINVSIEVYRLLVCRQKEVIKSA